MANLRELIPAFFTGPNGQRLTPEQIAQRQSIAQSLMESAMDTSPTAGGWASVLAKGVQGYSAGRDRRLADRATEANATESQNAIAALLGGVGQSPSATMAAQPSAMMPASSGASIMDSLPTANASSIASSAQAPSLAVASSNASAPNVGGDWLRYRNQGATRNQPLNEQLVAALSFLPELGVTAEVFSGGQPGKGSGLARVGSTRHDHGNAADVFFYQGDRRLDWNNEQDRPLFEQIVQRGKSAGITGFGAGPGYMQPGSMHIGFGNPGIWGAGGKAQNAPEWLANAYNGQALSPSNAADATRAMAAGQPQQAMASPQAAPVQQAQAGGINPAIVQALSSPYVDSNTRSIAGMLLGNQLQKQQAEQEKLRAEQAAQIRMQERTQAAQAAGVDPRYIGDDEIWKQAASAQFREQPTDIREYEYARDQGYAGSFAQFQQEQKRAGATQLSVNTAGANDFFAGLSNAEGNSYQKILSSAPTAARTLGQLDQLEDLLSGVETGALAQWKQVAGNYGVNTEGLNEIQAASALINQMVPSQRPPGSGPMSDADLELFKQSVPRIINQPGGNDRIIQTMRAINRYDMELANVIQEGLAAAEATENPQDRALIRAEMRKKIGSLQNPLENFNTRVGKSSSSGNRTSSGVQWSID